MMVTVRWARVVMDACGVRRVSCRTKRSQADGKAVWSWRRDRGVKLAGRHFGRRRWQTTPLTGESTE
jgi:hypothetical protein